MLTTGRSEHRREASLKAAPESVLSSLEVADTSVPHPPPPPAPDQNLLESARTWVTSTRSGG